MNNIKAIKVPSKEHKHRNLATEKCQILYSDILYRNTPDCVLGFLCVCVCVDGSQTGIPAKEGRVEYSTHLKGRVREQLIFPHRVAEVNAIPLSGHRTS